MGVASQCVAVRSDPAALIKKPAITHDPKLVLSTSCLWIFPTVHEVYEHRQRAGNAVYLLTYSMEQSPS